MTTNQGSESRVAVSGKKKTPLILMASAPLMGHAAPALHLARELIRRGHEVVFMIAPEFKNQVERVGAEFFENTPFWPPGTQEDRKKLPHGLPRVLFDLEHICIASIPPRALRLREVLEELRERDPERRVIIVSETMALGALPFMYGAPLPRGYKSFPKVINFNVIPLMLTSIDTGPFGFGLPPDSTTSGRARNQAMNQLLGAGPFAPLLEAQAKTLKSMGCRSNPDGFPMDSWIASYDTCFQMCSSSLEYPRSDLNDSIRFAGFLPKRGVDPEFTYPSWWSELTTNSALPAGSDQRKRVVSVTQGTIATDYSELIVPTLKALAGRDDLLVVAMLGVRGASLGAHFEIPINARVIDYLPYDAALEHSDIFVTNGGYGSMMHGVLNGVPMVMAGITEDKIEVSARAEWAGLTVNLRTQTPNTAQIGTGIDKVFAEPAYKRKAVRLQKENRDLDSISIIEREIWHYSNQD